MLQMLCFWIFLLSQFDSESPTIDMRALACLRQLRPVSYYFKQGSESKYMRFGFIGPAPERVSFQKLRKPSQKAKIISKFSINYQ